MTTTDLEVAIREIINRLYCVLYCGCLTVKEIYNDCNRYDCCTKNNDDLQRVGYECIIGLNNNDKPIRISYYGSEEDFLVFISKEIKNRKLNKVRFFNKYTIPETRDLC